MECWKKRNVFMPNTVGFFGKLCQHFCLEKRAWQAFDSETTPTNFLWEFCANTLFWYVCSFSAILATFLSVFLWRIIDCFDLGFFDKNSVGKLDFGCLDFFQFSCLLLFIDKLFSFSVFSLFNLMRILVQD